MKHCDNVYEHTEDKSLSLSFKNILKISKAGEIVVRFQRPALKRNCPWDVARGRLPAQDIKSKTPESLVRGPVPACHLIYAGVNQ